jgi:dihydrofolate synthase / folylpolyglutamate synthase
MKRKPIPDVSTRAGFIRKNGNPEWQYPSFTNQNSMTYEKTLKYIMEQLPMYQRVGTLAYRTGLENTYKLDDYFDHPHRHFKTIHIAGTNGKGSVSHMLASVLQEAGYKTGLYTSPHLVDFRERIKINGKMISRKFVADFITKHKDFFETFNPSFFEISVFLAFRYYKENHIDLAIVETGLGGRLDSTNIISPLLSVITNIGKDHTEILGDTLQKIAVEKAGIIKRNIPVVVGEGQPETLPVFLDKSVQESAPLYIASDLYRIDYSLLSIDEYQVFNVKNEDEVRYTNLKCGLLGHYQMKNTVTVLAAVDQLRQAGLVITEKDIYAGIRNVVTNTGLMGRWQVIQHNPTVVCDTAHNADGIKVVIQQIQNTPHKNLHLVMGFVNDKDIDQIIQYWPKNAFYYFTRLSVPRTMDQHDLVNLALRKGYKGEVFSHVSEALAAAKKKASTDDLLVITGSNFLVADALADLR